MQRNWSSYLDPYLTADFSNRSLRSQGSIGSVSSTRSNATSTRRLLPRVNVNNNFNYDDYGSHYTSRRRPHVVDDYHAARAHYTPRSRAPSSKSRAPSSKSREPSSNTDDIFSASNTNISLSVNYIPSKFSEFRNRKGGKYDDEPNLPKPGGGIYAFRSNEPRMSQGEKSLRWNKFKWGLFVTNSLFTLYTFVALVVCLLTWFDVWENSYVVCAGNAPELILSTLTAIIGLLTSLIGWAGILLNNRGFLAWYTFMTWITFAFLVSPGYLTYKRRTFNLEGKINAQWSRNLDTMGRFQIQNQLNCCGYFSPFVEATVSQTCYARSILPGCKSAYLHFEKNLLPRWYKAVFALVPVQLLIMIAGLLCSNNITYRFGKGMMPEAYRLNVSSMSVIMDKYADQLADQYGADVANTILKRFRSKPLRGNSHTSGTPRYSRRKEVPKYPFRSKYGQQSNTFLGM